MFSGMYWSRWEQEEPNIFVLIQYSLMEVAFKVKWFKADFLTVCMYERTNPVLSGHPNE